jgi:hypothetical protein
MTVTSSSLFKAAGAAAAIAGAVFVAVQVGHPSSTSFATQTHEWVIRSCAKAVMAVLALAGITGMYLRQHRTAGLLGLAGYLVFAAGYVLMLTVEVVAAAVLPGLVGREPGYVNDVVAAAVGSAHSGDIGGLQAVFDLAGAGYLIGGLLFGIALYRARVLARWAAALLALSTVATAALAVLPEAFDRPLAVPEGVALIGLGISLWRNAREVPDAAATRRSAPEYAGR